MIVDFLALCRCGTAMFLVLLAVIGSVGHSHAQGSQSVFPEPGLSNPRLQFNTGRVVNNTPEISPVLPAIPGPASEWKVGQWNQTEHLSPQALQFNDPQTHDPLLGVARYAFTDPRNRSHIWIYWDQEARRFVYDLYQSDGDLKDAGGANTFLGAKSAISDASFDRVIEFDVDAKVSRAAVSYATPAAGKNGAVVAMAFWAFTLQHTDPATRKVTTVFNQIPIAQSRPAPLDYHACRIGPRGNMVLTVAQELPGSVRLPFEPAAGPLIKLHYRLNDYLCALLTRTYQCRQGKDNKVLFQFSEPALDFANWRIVGTYNGLETQNTDARSTSTLKGPQGSASIGIQVAGFRVTRYLDRPFNFHSCQSPPMPAKR